jgi:electron transfer flavoprotein alpha/beta subunit
VDLREGGPTAPSLFALTEARRVAQALGATVYALVVGGPLGAAADALATTLGRAGADKLLLLEDSAAAVSPVEPLWRAVLDAIIERLGPRLFFWPAGSVGLQLGPVAAVRLGASFFPRASVEIAQGGPEGEARLSIRRWSDSQDGFWTAGVGASFAPAVVTLAAGYAERMPGAAAAEVTVLRAETPRSRGVEIVERGPAPHAAAELASTVVLLPDAEKDKTAPHLAAPGRPDVVVLSEGASLAPLEGASPKLVVLLSSRGSTAALGRLRLAPDAHVVALASGRRGPPKSPLIDHIWKVERPQAIAHLGAAFSEPITPPVELVQKVPA